MQNRLFQKEYSAKTFVLLFFVSVFAIHLCAFYIYQANFPFTANDVLYAHQIKKLEQATGTIQTLIVGDSSAGNALDAAHFSKISGAPTISLALTGSYGIVGTYHLVEQARTLHPEIKNVLIVQTPDIWTRPFSREGYFKTKLMRHDDIPDVFFTEGKIIDGFTYVIDVRWIYRFAKYMLNGQPKIELVNDYYQTSETQETYHNGLRVIDPSASLHEALNGDNLKVYQTLDAYCFHENINCIFISGPVHQTLLDNTDPEYLEKLFTYIDTATYIRTPKVFFGVPNEHMGDSADHVDFSYKKEMTEKYFTIVGEYLW